MTTEQFIKDIRPGQKNINTIFIVLEIGKPGNKEEVRESFCLTPSELGIKIGKSDRIFRQIPALELQRES